MENKIEIHNMNLHYGNFHALHDINLDIKANEITAFIGPSGCGKSTLLRSLNRMNDLVEGCRITGDIQLDGQDIYKNCDVNLLRRRVGMVFQKPNPFPMSIYDNIAYGPRTHGIRSRVQLDEIVETSLRRAAIWDETKDSLNKSALSMSGGQQQRICIARPRRRSGGPADGRADLRARPNLDRKDRRPCARTEKRLYYRYGHAQYAAGHSCFGYDRILPPRRHDRSGRYGEAVLHAARQAYRGLHHGEVRLI